jgi:hypothetical protein
LKKRFQNLLFTNASNLYRYHAAMVEAAQGGVMEQQCLRELHMHGGGLVHVESSVTTHSLQVYA